MTKNGFTALLASFYAIKLIIKYCSGPLKSKLKSGRSLIEERLPERPGLAPAGDSLVSCFAKRQVSKEKATLRWRCGQPAVLTAAGGGETTSTVAFFKRRASGAGYLNIQTSVGRINRLVRRQFVAVNVKGYSGSNACAKHPMPQSGVSAPAKQQPTR